jgi:excisionase family DNA binding protein
MVMPEYAAAQAAVRVRTVYRWIEAGNIHFAETPGGGVLICETSLANRISELRIADFSVEAWK